MSGFELEVLGHLESIIECLSVLTGIGIVVLIVEAALFVVVSKAAGWSL